MLGHQMATSMNPHLIADSNTSSHARYPTEDGKNLPRVLSLDAYGRIMDWISWREAAHLYARDAVAWTLGEPCFTLRGGINRISGRQSLLDLHPIVATRGQARACAAMPSPALTNTALFARDAHLCLYCGKQFSRFQLTRDHVLPRSQGGSDIWENVISSCLSCNTRKGGRTPTQANMPLLAVPFRPSWVEHLILSNRNILSDQMEFLRNHLPNRHPRGRFLTQTVDGSDTDESVSLQLH